MIKGWNGQGMKDRNKKGRKSKIMNDKGEE